MIKLSEKIKKINIDGTITFSEEMKNFTTFKTGGRADVFVRASSVEDVIKIKQFAAENAVPLFILGGGANILVSDYGIRGITLYTGDLNKVAADGSDLIFESGIEVNALAEAALDFNLSGLEFIYGMPGTAGGALWMNARCYGSEVSYIFQWADVLNEKNTLERIRYRAEDWGYKISPFQNRKLLILRACFRLKRGIRDEIRSEMDKNYKDRNDKGHFKAPCAGSVFKNNRAFGKPSGQIIDEAGLRGLRIGSAVVSDFHANIIINEGGAKASEILELINLVKVKVKETSGFDLEPEVIPVGDWR
ncbi:UDP-N-acetylmuramate dehydrogenase [Spirochaeta isovalerica]|uniref:UDP-N-acetylenolpyruvoylglucosamine reductase n=1 Tax=Spirochaeta isovalerica TaxID=150 RepID=A0A841R3P8_9SPIO|nr:UDP-N-acetylmuramate dehydrogenase [Spirochaeta isovalerica]